MARKLIIVARQHGDLYHYLRKRFAERRIDGIVGRGGTSTRGSTRDRTQS